MLESRDPGYAQNLGVAGVLCFGCGDYTCIWLVLMASSPAAKWAAIAKCSSDTALRDITDLLARGVLRKSAGGGRSTSYELNALPKSQRS